MGVSTNAILFYGYCWEDEAEHRVFQDQETEWTELVLRSRGEHNPWNDCPETELATLPYAERRRREDQWCEEHRAELDSWHAKKEAVEKEFGVEVGRHCSDECPMPYVGIIGAGVLASRGNPEKIDISMLAVGEDWDAKLDRFMKELRIRRPHKKPRWWLVSFWG